MLEPIYIHISPRDAGKCYFYFKTSCLHTMTGTMQQHRPFSDGGCCIFAAIIIICMTFL